MSKRMSRGTALVCVAAALLSVAGCPFSSKIFVKNSTLVSLTPYPVKSEPPPPHRAADLAGSIGQGGTAEIDPHGFNPVYYQAGVTDPTKANGLYIGLDMDDTPYVIQYKVFHYKVPPGEAGKDPAKQPILLHSGVVEVSNVDTQVTISTEFPVGEPIPPGGWKVVIAPT